MLMPMHMRRNKYCKPMMDQHRLWRTEGRVADLDRHECDEADAHQEELASQADDESMQNVQD